MDRNTALILIDIQKGFDDVEYWGGNRNNPNAEEKVLELLNYWRVNNMPVIHVKHCSTDPNSILAEGQEGNEFKDFILPQIGEEIYKKNVNSAFIGTTLELDLRKRGIDNLVIAGLTTDHCVSTSTRMAGNLGFSTILVADACATFDKVGFNGDEFSAQLIHDTAIASINEEFAKVLNTNDIIK